MLIISVKRQLRRFWIYVNKNDALYLFWATLIYYFLSILNLNNKTIFLSLIGLGFIYNLRFRDIRRSLLFITLTSLIFLVGKTWVVQLISPKILRSTDYPRGYISFIVITPFQIFSSLVLAFLIRDLMVGYQDIRKKMVRLFFQPYFIFLFLFFTWQILSALMADNIYNLALTYSLQSLSYLVFFIGLLLYFTLDPSYYVKIAGIFGAMTVFEIILASLQWLQRSTLELAIETVEETLTFFKGPGQGFFSVRSVGTFSHPNELALFFLFMALFFLTFLYLNTKQLSIKKNFYLGFVGAAVVGLVLSLGRSAWLTFFICLLLFFYFMEKKWNKHIVSLEKIKTKTLLYLVLFFMIALPVTIPRMLNSFDLFKPTGGGETRMKLIKESINLIKLKPIFGTGMGLSGYMMFRISPRGVISTFPSVVHNFYLLITNESGLPALFFFLGFLFFLIKKIKHKFNITKLNDKIRLLGTLTVLLSFLINGLMHQIFLMGFFLINATLTFIGNHEKNKR